MDIISHGLWGGIAFGRQRKIWLAFLFGVLPDLCSFAPFFIYTKLNNIHFHRAPPLDIIPPWVFTIYDVGHSLLFFALVYMLLLKINKGLSLYSLAWLLHILLDIPTHSAEYFPTKFLYPVSDFIIDGQPWASPLIWYPNLALLLTLYGLHIFSLLRDKRKVSADNIGQPEKIFFNG
ncbi:MAG: hypothetical protein OEY01_08135 [Desulfobulbaceae bacterium]|nr:hypothetical protein [Desulfobulbaceae bacterium]